MSKDMRENRTKFREKRSLVQRDFLHPQAIKQLAESDRQPGGKFFFNLANPGLSKRLHSTTGSHWLIDNRSRFPAQNDLQPFPITKVTDVKARGTGQPNEFY